jgi:hypothetical protein
MNPSGHLLAELRGGDLVSATDRNANSILCVVEVTAPHLGVLWAWDLQNHQRILMSSEDFHFSKEHEDKKVGSGSD